MSTLTTKELTALSEQIKAEQVLVKKYRKMAELASDGAVKTDLNSFADKHQQHANTLMGFLQ
ncbi:MAG: spore coat protein [Oscillospiraceae bacterium]|jgi:rubrerythrin|nr:spore coat protein [Oscillospiraceae bacterium]